MNKPSIYLAGPVKERDDSGAEWREEVKQVHGDEFHFVDPLDKYDPDDDQQPSPAEIVATDLQLINESDAVLVRYDGEPTWGTPMEVAYTARECDKAIVIAWTADTQVSPWAQHYATAVRGSVDHALSTLETLASEDPTTVRILAGVDGYDASEDVDQAYAGRDQPDTAEMPSGDELASMLAEDVATLLTDSRDSHGDAVENQQHIADAWSWYTGADIDGVDVARMMELVKMSRAVVGEYDLDHDRDIVGYGAIAAACAVASDQAPLDDLQEHAGGD